MRLGVSHERTALALSLSALAAPPVQLGWSSADGGYEASASAAAPLPTAHSPAVQEMTITQDGVQYVVRVSIEVAPKQVATVESEVETVSVPSTESGIPLDPNGEALPQAVRVANVREIYAVRGSVELALDKSGVDEQVAQKAIGAMMSTLFNDYSPGQRTTIYPKGTFEYVMQNAGKVSNARLRTGLLRAHASGALVP